MKPLGSSTDGATRLGIEHDGHVSNSQALLKHCTSKDLIYHYSTDDM